VVVATYPPSGGAFGQSTSWIVSWYWFVTIGRNGCSMSEALEASWVSRVKIRGTVIVSSVK
jgi:hypothetical protein